MVAESEREELERLRKRVEELERQAERVGAGLDACSVSLWDMDLRTGEVAFVHPWHRILGYTDEEAADTWALGRRIADPDDFALSEVLIAEMIAGKRDSIQFTARVRDAIGEWWRLRWQGRVVERDEQGAPIRAYGVTMDVTDQYEAQQARDDAHAQLDRIIETFPGVIWMTRCDKQHTPLFLSGFVEKLFGYSREEFMNGSVWFSDIAFPEDLKRTKGAVAEALAQKRNYDVELRFRHKDGHTIWVREIGSAIYGDDGRAECLMGTMLDLTERKASENAQREAEEHFRGLVENSPDTIMTVDRTGRILFVNRSAVGQTREQLIGTDSFEVLPPSIRKRYAEALLHVFDEGNPDGFEHTTSDGSSWSARLVPLKDGGKVVSAMLIWSDVTERVRAKAALELREIAERSFRERLTALQEVVNELSLARSNNVLCRRAVELGRERLGFDRLGVWFTTPEPDVVMGAYGTDEAGKVRDERGILLGVDRRSVMGQVLHQHIRMAYEAETAVFDQQGEPVGSAGHAVAALWDGNTVIGYLTMDNFLTHEEITDVDCELLSLYASSLGHLCTRVRVEEALNASEGLYRTLVESAGEAISTIDADGVFLFMNGTAAQRLGGAPEDFIGKTMWDIFPESDADRQAASVRRVIETGEGAIFESPTLVGGVERWYSTSIQPVREPKEGCRAALVIARDQTERIRAQRALERARDELEERVTERTAELRETSARLQTAMDSLPFEFFVLDEDQRCVLQNAVCRAHWGDAIGKGPDDVVQDPDVVDMWRRNNARAFKGERVAGEATYRYGDEERHYYNIISPIFDGDRVRGILGCNIDITDRVRAQREVADTKEYLATLIDTSHDGILVVDAEGCFEFGNDAFFTTFGWPREELIGKFFMKVIPEDLHAFMMERWEEVQAGHGQPYETDVLRKDGERRTIAVTHHHMTIAGERKYCVVVRDITARKKAEAELSEYREHLEEMVILRTEELTTTNLTLQREVAERRRVEQALRTSEEQYRSLVQNLNIGVYRNTGGPRGRFLHGNPALFRMFGYETMDAFSEISVADLYQDPDDRVAFVREVQEKGHVRNRELLLKKRDGTAIWCSVTAQATFDDGGKIKWMDGVIEDITERKTADMALKQYEEQLRSLASEVSLAEERERRRIAEALHDNIGQNLALARIRVSEARELGESDELNKCLDDIASFVRQSLDYTRRHTFELSSPVLYELGLVPALETLVDKMGAQQDFDIEFDAQVADVTLSQDVELMLYQGVRELIINTAKHANADKMRISVRRHHDLLIIDVSDDGVGFDSESARERLDKPDGFGLFNIAERLQHVGGRFDLKAEEGKGTHATLVVPLPPEEEASTD